MWNPKILKSDFSRKCHLVGFRLSRLILRQDPLEAILVIFGRRALIFFLFESS